MQRTTLLKPKVRVKLGVMLERITYTSMLSGFIGLISYLAVNCYHAA
ncbi:MAG: hypothetical protein QXU32_00470 [Nitrososphaerales archaeon]